MRMTHTDSNNFYDLGATVPLPPRPPLPESVPAQFSLKPFFAQQFFLISFLATGVALFVLTSCTSSITNVSIDPYSTELATYPELDESSSSAAKEAKAQFYFALAEKYTLKEIPNKALRFYEKAYSLDPRTVLAEKILATEKELQLWEKGLADGKKFTLFYPKSTLLRTLYAEFLFQNKNIDEAIHQLLAIQDKKEYTPYLLLINAYLYQQKTAKAYPLALEMTEKFPALSLGWIYKAKICIWLDKKSEAITAALRAYQLSPHDVDVALFYAFSLDQNKKSEALAIYNQIFIHNPTNLDLIKRTTSFYQTFGSLENALDLLNTLTSQQNKADRAGADLQKFFLLLELSKIDDAKTVLSAIKEEIGKNRFHFLMASALTRQNDLNNALIEVNQIEQDSEYYYASLFQKIRLLEIEERKEELLVFLESLDIKDMPARLITIVCSLYSKLKKPERAEKVIDIAIEVYKEDLDLLFLKGVYQEQRGNWKACIETMTQLLHKNPYYSSALNYIAYLYAEKDMELETSEKLLLEALDIQPSNGYYLDSLGWVYYKQGKWEKSKACLLLAISTLPQESIIAEHLGDVYNKLEDTRKALVFYKAAHKNATESDDQNRLAKKINETEKHI